jgi:acyl-coenzyme A thioesterase 13
MNENSNSKLAFFKKMVGQKLTQTPSAAGNWLAGTLLAIEYGYAKVEYEVRIEFCNPGRILHGGISSLMLDDVIGMANFGLGSEYLMSSINLNVDFLSSVKLGEKVQVESKLIRSGTNVNHWEAVITNESGKIVAKASSNMINTHLKLNDLKL